MSAERFRTQRKPQSKAFKKKMTVSTLQRYEKMKLMVMRLMEGEMTVPQAMELFGYSSSGVRKYIYELMDANICIIKRTEVSSNNVGEKIIYGISDDTSAIERFMGSAGEVLERKAKTAPEARKTIFNSVMIEAGRTIHILGDDSNAKLPKLTNVVIRRDEMDCYLFGPAKVAQ